MAALDHSPARRACSGAAGGGGPTPCPGLTPGRRGGQRQRHHHPERQSAQGDRDLPEGGDQLAELRHRRQRDCHLLPAQRPGDHPQPGPRGWYFQHHGPDHRQRAGLDQQPERHLLWPRLKGECWRPDCHNPRPFSLELQRRHLSVPERHPTLRHRRKRRAHHCRRSWLGCLCRSWHRQQRRHQCPAWTGSSGFRQ